MSNLKQDDHYKIKYEGMVFESNNYGKFTIIKYTNSRCVLIKFKSTGSEKTVGISEINDGKVKDDASPSVFGVGVFGNKKGGMRGYDSNHKKTKEYELWTNMLGRCYGYRKDTCYDDCTVSDDWLYFDNFCEWINDQDIDLSAIKYNLDKDLLSKGEKLYSKETCCLIPNKINMAIVTKRKSSNRTLPISVGFSGKTKFMINMTIRGEIFRIAGFNTPHDAHIKYCEVKENYIKELTEEYKAFITNSTYEALLNFKVDSNE
jgi:hypothetical protein